MFFMLTTWKCFNYDQNFIEELAKFCICYPSCSEVEKLKTNSQISKGSKTKADKTNARPEVCLSGTPSPPPRHCNFFRTKMPFNKNGIFNHAIMTHFDFVLHVL